MSVDVELREISFLSDDFEILQDVTITFPGGKSTVVIGPSGCGKSTLLKVAAGLHIPDKGKLLIGGKDFFKLSEIEVKKIRKQNGFVFQDSALWANRTMYQNLSIPLEFHFPTLSKKEIGLRVMRLLAKTGLDKQSHLRPEQLSSGEQKVVSFLRALVLRPALFFMDEPTLSMDEDKVVIIYDMIRELKDSGCTLIAVTHDQNLTSWLADYLVILKEGRVLVAGPYDEIRQMENRDIQAILGSVLGKNPPVQRY